MTREPKRGAATPPTDARERFAARADAAGPPPTSILAGDMGAPCVERLAICAESGDVSELRARELAADDARRCAEGRACVCAAR